MSPIAGTSPKVTIEVSQELANLIEHFGDAGAAKRLASRLKHETLAKERLARERQALEALRSGNLELAAKLVAKK